MQNTAETMSNLKTGKPVTPKQASEAASVIKEDNISKGGPANLFEEVPEGVDKSVWESFNSQFDLTTIGLTLMATNGNGQNLAANMGLALQAGMESKRNEASASANAKLKAEDRALEAKKTLSEIAKNNAAAFKSHNEGLKVAKGDGQLVPEINATKQAQGVDVLLSAGFKGKSGEPETNRLGKVYAELAESERLNGFQGNPAAKIIPYMIEKGFFKDTSWYQRGNFAAADLGAQLGLN
jgi:hypothetical protein